MKTIFWLIIAVIFIAYMIGTSLSFKPLKLSFEWNWIGFGWLIMLIGLLAWMHGVDIKTRSNHYRENFDSFASASEKTVGVENTIKILDTLIDSKKKEIERIKKELKKDE